MTSSVLWKPVTVPQRSLLTAQSGAAPHQINQLQFSLGIPRPTSEQLATRFRKPQPIVIEKISGQTQTQQLVVPYSHVTTPSAFPVLPSVSSSLSSDRLALAVHLAKKDVKKVRELGTENVLVSQDDEAQSRHLRVSSKGKGPHGKKSRTKSSKSRSQDVLSQDAITLRERVHQTVKKQDIAAKRQHEMYFYPVTRDDGFDSDRERTQADEIRKLRKELHQYMEQMEGLKNERPEVLRNKDKRLKRRRDGEARLSDDDVDQRQMVRAEEQAARSARMLYVLQRQVSTQD